MKFTYTVGVRIPVGKILPKWREIEDRVNNTMKGFGFAEKMMQTYVQDFQVSVTRELTDAEIDDLKKLMQKSAREQFEFAEIEYFIVEAKEP
jgi:hypothetical protein